MTETFALLIGFSPEHKDLVHGTLYDLEVTAFQEGGVGDPADSLDSVPEADQKVTCFFENQTECLAFEQKFVETVALDQTQYSLHRSSVAASNWQDAWKEFAEPVEISQRLLICPSWKRAEPKTGQCLIELDPANAFGSGSHETTRLCLELLDQHLQLTEVASALDVGCGSGVLAIAAATLGVPSVVGIDITEEIAETARGNAAKNNCSGVSFSSTELGQIDGKFDLVLANILSSILRELLPALISHVSPNGTIILSGILLEEEAGFLAALSRPELTLVRTKRSESWIAVELKRAAVETN